MSGDLTEHKVFHRVLHLAISGHRIVACDGFLAIHVFDLLTCLLLFLNSSVFNFNYDIVERIKQFPDYMRGHALSFLGDVVYIGGHQHIAQWNVVTDTVVKLEGYDGMVLRIVCLICFK